MFYWPVGAPEAGSGDRLVSGQGLPDPNLGQLLDYVALGTVADVVELDRINRTLVHQGLLRIRWARHIPAFRRLAEVSGRKPATR